MKRIMFLIATAIAVTFGAEAGNSVFDNYLKEASSRCQGGQSGSFLCDAIRAYNTMEIRGISINSDPYARMILCSNFALATKYERDEIYEGADVALSYKANGEIAWVLITRMKKQCGSIAKDIVQDKYLVK